MSDWTDKERSRYFTVCESLFGSHGEATLNLIFTDTLLFHFLVSLLRELKGAAESRPMVYGVMESRSKETGLSSVALWISR